MMPTVLFAADPLAPTQPDPAFAAEAAAATRAGFAVALLDYEQLVQERNVARALRRVPQQDARSLCLYRGWMLPVERYAALATALTERGYKLLHDPEVYRTCHELPAAYPYIAGATPRTVWLPQEDGLGLEQIVAALAPFGEQPVIVKDYVKSRKFEWLEACFIPSAADRAAVARVTGRFLELQGEELQGGLVFREYVPFRTAGIYPQGGMPLAVEYRALIFDGEPLLTQPYWEQTGELTPPDLTPFLSIIARIPSRFFTLDLAQHQDGSWLIVELGDGQVAGLPPGTDVEMLYGKLVTRLLS